MKRKLWCLGFCFLISLTLCLGLDLTVWAANEARSDNATTANQRPSWFCPDRFNFLVGYGYQETGIHRPTHFQQIYLLSSLIVPLTRSIGPSWFRGRVEWNPEVGAGSFLHPYARPFLEFSPVQFHYAFEPIGHWSPYVIGSTGIFMANIKTAETEVWFNFNSQIGLGTGYAVTDRVSLLVEYRYGHISNAGIHGRDHGMETQNFLVGVSKKI